ncbi:MAG: DUF5106 domain-containing protein [Bacteroidaceae bacterium]|nr:DUF5106 domain-containing protein [Bacteroidaceae bacterium]
MRRIVIAMACVLASMGVGAQDVQFPFPEVPAMMTDTQARLKYVLENFWSRYNFADGSTYNEQVGEQGFSEFINLLSYADAATCKRAVDGLMKYICGDERMTKRFDSLTDHYLGNPNSPLRNDVTYEQMLRGLLSSKKVDEARRSRMEFKLSLVARNQPGTKGADFEYVDRVGRRHRMYDLQSELTLLVFSDPECEHCHELMPKIMGSKVLAGDRRLKVLSIYPDENVKAWMQMRPTLPHNWSEGRSPGGKLMHDQTYYLPAMPVLYLLDKDKKVIIKDGTLEQVEKALSANEK